MSSAPDATIKARIFIHRGPFKVPAVERFWPRVVKTDDCWEWVGGTDRDGYGVLWGTSRSIRAHRFSYEAAIAHAEAVALAEHKAGTCHLSEWSCSHCMTSRACGCDPE